MTDKKVADMLKQIKETNIKEYDKLVEKMQKLIAEHPKLPPKTP